MLTKIIKDESFLIAAVKQHYDLRVSQIDFIPKGDISFAYVVTCAGGEKYFLKLLAKDLAGSQARIRQLDDYLPTTWEMFHQGLCKHISYPIKTIDGLFHVDIGSGVIVIFNFIEGETLADAYPFSKPVLNQVAKAIAVVHQATAQLSPTLMRVESFDLPFATSLLAMLKALTCEHEFHHPDQQNLKRYIVPRQNIILRFLATLQEYQKSTLHAHKNLVNVRGCNRDQTDSYKMEQIKDCNRDPINDYKKDLVLTHGDYWGGNMIVDRHHQLHIVDWESCKLAAPEADLHLYLTDDFAYFIKQYQTYLEIPVILTRDCFGFYAYKNQLSNLNNWMSRILYDHQSKEQNDNDFDCIINHCMTRWDDLAEAVQDLPAVIF